MLEMMTVILSITKVYFVLNVNFASHLPLSHPYLLL